ncbi:MAG: hypothetical protein ACJ0SL_04470 [Candidatus Rariloculaceae bacterium]
MRKARLLSEQARWNEAIGAAEAALAAGGLEDSGETLLLKGVAQAELGRYDEALATLQEVSSQESTAATSAAAWSDYVRDRQQAAASLR